ncbi:hypothetical protein QR685DRAFT_593247 [Neurospora intermedia]|uniref:Questionable protein n=1 Tax=Neurospora intermedia TaxID=5142 RepID=A0ABR3DQ23_NEUIN
MELSSSGPKYRDAEWAWPPTRGVACENLPTSCLLLFASSVIWGAARRSFPRKKTKIDATETPGTHDGSWGKSPPNIFHHTHRVRRVDVRVSVDTKLGFRCYLGSFT